MTPYIQELDEETISSLGVQSRIFIFAIHTKFKVLRNLDPDDEDEDVYDSEKEDFAVSFTLERPGDFRELFDQHFSHINFRLNEYLMPNHLILDIIHCLHNLADQIMSVHPSVPVVPIIVDVDVCTLQLVGETIDKAFERSVRPESLIPLELVRPIEKGNNKLCRLRVRDFLLYGLPMVRVEEGSDVMETCPICMGGPRGGALVSRLPCKHAFHSHCVVRWLMKRQSCPMCRHEIVLEKGGRPKELGC
ncbi:hypothetical protein CASFOL_036922 [Castilleja foliolosa]|uniref:RING-type domain-containing protein n=1 Tax=Castilleja foliolosa TaxID=1961234 RepID=A0ABD3BRL0_9LAMI